MALGSMRGSVVCRGQLRRGVSDGLRAAMEAKELIGGRVVLAPGTDLFPGPGLRFER
jgi:hypothetical protein